MPQTIPTTKASGDRLPLGQTEEAIESAFLLAQNHLSRDCPRYCTQSARTGKP